MGVHSVLPPHHAAGDNMARMMEDAGRAWAAPLLEEVDEEADFGRWLAHFSGDAETSAELLARVTAVLETLMARGEEARAAADAAALAAGGAPGAAAAARVTLFHGLRPPPIGLAAYLERIAKYSRCSPVCFVVGLAYLQRLAAADPAALAPSPLNVHRLALTATMLAAKFLDDHYYNNAYYAKIGGIGTGEMNRLEVEMLGLLGHRLYLSPTALRSFVAQLEGGGVPVEPTAAAALAAAAAAAAAAPAAMAALAAAAEPCTVAKKRKSFTLCHAVGGEDVTKRRHSCHDAFAAAAAEGATLVTAMA